MDANTLAKIAGGICDNLLTCIARAWYFDGAIANKIGIFAPAMNTAMWRNPLTLTQLDVLRNTLKWEMIEPISKALACGEVGIGAMEEPGKIVEFLQKMKTSRK